MGFTQVWDVMMLSAETYRTPTGVQRTSARNLLMDTALQSMLRRHPVSQPVRAISTEYRMVR